MPKRSAEAACLRWFSTRSSSTRSVTTKVNSLQVPSVKTRLLPAERADKNEGVGQRCGDGGGQGIPGDEEAEQARAVGASAQHEQAQAQFEQEEPAHHSVDAPAPAQGQEVEIVEMRSNIGDAWGRGCALVRGHCHNLHNCPQLAIGIDLVFLSHFFFCKLEHDIYTPPNAQFITYTLMDFHKVTTHK